jgi:hypothetical protein
VDTVATFLAEAEACLPAPAPRVVAVGGLSGTGKSTLGRALAPLVPPVPGALHLRSDVIRKALAGVGETERLPPEAYAPGTSQAVYAAMMTAARKALAEGRSVILDAVFARPAEREAAASLGSGFTGIWLEAPLDLRQARIADRRNDASDATPAVAAAQETLATGAIDWHHLTAGGDREALAARAEALLA